MALNSFHPANQIISSSPRLTRNSLYSTIDRSEILFDYKYHYSRKEANLQLLELSFEMKLVSGPVIRSLLKEVVGTKMAL